MTWWSSGNKHPKQKSRFLVEFGNGGVSASVKSCSKPSLTIESKEYQMINHFYNYPGNGKWEGISIKFVDAGNWGTNSSITIAGRQVDVTPPNAKFTAHALWDMVIASGYTPPNWVTAIQQTNASSDINPAFGGRALISSPEKASMADLSFGRLLIHQLHPQGRTADGFIFSIETWELYNPTVTKVSWGDLDYGDDGLVEYTLDLKYDFANFYPANPNISEASTRKTISNLGQGIAALQQGMTQFSANFDPFSDESIKRAIKATPNYSAPAPPIASGAQAAGGGTGLGSSDSFGNPQAGSLGINSVTNINRDDYRQDYGSKPTGPTYDGS